MNNIIQFLIGTTGISAVIIFLGKFLLAFLRDKELERYKNELLVESLKFKSDLDRRNEKFKISYSNLFTDQLEIIKETYKRLVRAEKPLEYLMRPIKFGPVQTKEESADQVVLHANELFKYYDENELIFSDKSVNIFNSIRQSYFNVWNTFSRTQIMGDNISSEMKIKLIDDMSKAYELILQGEMQKLKLELKTDFRKQLGFIEEEVST